MTRISGEASFIEYEWRPSSDPAHGTEEGRGWFHANSKKQALHMADIWRAELRQRRVGDWEPFDPHLTDDGVAAPPADQTVQQVRQHLGSGVAAESATTTAAPSSPSCAGCYFPPTDDVPEEPSYPDIDPACPVHASMPTREQVTGRLAEAMAQSWMGDEVDCADVATILTPAVLTMIAGAS